jgi:hypothetical protein
VNQQFNFGPGDFNGHASASCLYPNPASVSRQAFRTTQRPTASEKNVARAESLLTAVSEAARAEGKTTGELIEAVARRCLSRERLDRLVRRNEHVADFDEIADRTGIGDD